MVAVNPTHAAQELLGWRGVLLGGLCFVMVAVAGTLALRQRWAQLARRLGDATYGMYLVHPVLYFYLLLIYINLFFKHINLCIYIIQLFCCCCICFDKSFSSGFFIKSVVQLNFLH